MKKLLPLEACGAPVKTFFISAFHSLPSTNVLKARMPQIQEQSPLTNLKI
jgi:hypothetical protein